MRRSRVTFISEKNILIPIGSRRQRRASWQRNASRSTLIQDSLFTMSPNVSWGESMIYAFWDTRHEYMSKDEILNYCYCYSIASWIWPMTTTIWTGATITKMKWHVIVVQAWSQRQTEKQNRKNTPRYFMMTNRKFICASWFRDNIQATFCPLSDRQNISYRFIDSVGPRSKQTGIGILQINAYIRGASPPPRDPPATTNITTHTTDTTNIN